MFPLGLYLCWCNHCKPFCHECEAALMNLDCEGVSGFLNGPGWLRGMLARFCHWGWSFSMVCCFVVVFPPKSTPTFWCKSYAAVPSAVFLSQIAPLLEHTPFVHVPQKVLQCDWYQMAGLTLWCWNLSKTTLKMRHPWILWKRCNKEARQTVCSVGLGV